MAMYLGSNEVAVTKISNTPTPASEPWTRPSTWPDLSQMDVSAGNIIYITSYADEARGFCDFYVTCTGSYTVELGYISGSSFITESTYTYNSNAHCKLYYGSANGTFKVLKVTGTNITFFRIYTGTGVVTIDDFKGFDRNQGIIDVVGKLPNCTGMTHSYLCNLVNMEISDVRLSGIRSQMFSSCTSLASLDVSSWDTSSVTNMSQMFSSCYSLTSLDVSSWNTSAVTNMGSMFYYCEALASLDVGGWDTSLVPSMNNIFAGCASLTSLDVSGWDTSSVTSMNSMFYYCYSLTSLDVSSWDTSSVTSMNNMFSSCYSLASLDVSSWDFSSVTSTNNMFYNSYGLHGSITIPATATVIGTNCFSACRSLYEWHFLATTPPTLGGTNAFSNMTDFGGKKIYVPAASLSAYQSASNWSTYASYMVGE